MDHPDRSAYQFERERAETIDRMRSLVLDRSAARRRAEILRARARQKERALAGAGLDAYNERFSDGWVEPNDSNFMLVMWWIGFVLKNIVFGPARLLGWLVLGLFERRVPYRASRVPLWHLVGAGVIAFLVWLPIAGAVGGFGAWILAQFALAPTFAAWRGYLWGWSRCLHNPPPTKSRPHDLTPQQENQAMYGTLSPLGAVEPPSADLGYGLMPPPPTDLPAIPDHLLIRPTTEEEA